MKSEHMYIIGFVVFIVIVIVLATRKNEGFTGLENLGYRIETVQAESPEAAAKGSFYSVPANYQSNLSPRMSNSLGYGSLLRTDMPSENNRGSPKDPLTYGESIDDEEDNEKDTQTDSKPQSITYNRLVYAQKKSRLKGLGDFIRGDLAIAPLKNTGWFNVSATPHQDLQAGAMTVMGGANESSHALSKLMYASSGKSVNAFTTGFGTNQYTTSANGKNGDLQVTAFP